MTDCCEPLQFTQGGSFSYAGRLVLYEDGVAQPPNFVGWPLAQSQLRKLDGGWPTSHTQAACVLGTPGALIANLVFEWVNQTTGDVRLYFAGSTATWLLGAAAVDVVFADLAGDLIPTTLAQINIAKGATQWLAP